MRYDNNRGMRLKDLFEQETLRKGDQMPEHQISNIEWYKSWLIQTSFDNILHYELLSQPQLNLNSTQKLGVT